MVPIARRMLLTDRRRALLGVAGVAVALVMVLALEGIAAGSTRQISRYIDTSPADVFVSQKGVRSIHMSISVLPADVVDQIAAIPGVAWSEPILLVGDSVRASRVRRPAYVIGYSPGEPGGPPVVVEGTEPGPGEIVIDDRAAAMLGVRIGDQVDVMGRSWSVSGVTTGMTSIVNTIVYVRYEDLGTVLGRPSSASYVLVGTDGGPAEVAADIERATGHTAQTRPSLSAEERSLVRQMSTDLMNVMAVASLVVGLAVIALVLSATVLSRLKDIGIMKALGLGRAGVTRLVLGQALATVAAAFVLAVGLTVGLGAGVARLTPDIDLVIESASLIRAAVGSLVVALAGAALPLLRVWRVDPATVFRSAS